MTSHAERILDRVSRSCSLNRVFVAGEEAAAIADQLRLRGAIVEESRASTIADVIDDLRAASTSFSLAIVCVAAPDLGDEDARYLCAALRRATSTAYLRVTAGTTPRHLEDIGSRPWWERHAVASGFRRHPSFAHLVAYEQLDASGMTPWLSPRGGTAAIRVVSGRTTGASLLMRTQRSGATRAHRISFAGTIESWTSIAVSAPVLRSWVLPHSPIQSWESFAIRPISSTQRHTTGPAEERWNSEWASPTDLSQFSDESFDVVLSCRPLPSTFWTADAIDEIRRVLTPGGRLICCVAEEDLAVRYQIAGGLRARARAWAERCTR